MDQVIQALAKAVANNSLTDIKKILEGGVGPINDHISNNPDIISPLQVAAAHENIDAVKYLVKAGIHVTDSPSLWESALHNHISTEIFLILFSQLQSEINVDDGSSAGVNAAVFEFLQKARDQNECTPKFLIDSVGLEGSVAMLSLVISLGMPVNTSNRCTFSLLHAMIATWDNLKRWYPNFYESVQLEKIRLLIGAGLQINTGHTSPYTVIEFAIMLESQNSSALVRLLLDSFKWDLNRESDVPQKCKHNLMRNRNIKTVTPLIMAMLNVPIFSNTDNQACIVSQLLEAGADCMKETENISPLFFAVERELSGKFDAPCGKSILDAILEFMTPAQVKASSTSNSFSLVMQTLLPEVTNSRGLRSKTLAKLLAKGADPDSLDGPLGLIPIFEFMLRSFAKNGIVEFSTEEEMTMQILLRSDVDIFQENCYGNSVFDLVN